jgi:hypothetical protein
MPPKMTISHDRFISITIFAIEMSLKIPFLKSFIAMPQSRAEKSYFAYIKRGRFSP